MTFGSACDGGLLSERRSVATAPTLPPPGEPTDEQIREALVATSVFPLWKRREEFWEGFASESSVARMEWCHHTFACQRALEYLARQGAK